MFYINEFHSYDFKSIKTKDQLTDTFPKVKSNKLLASSLIYFT